MLFDTHAHLDQEEFDADRAEVIRGARTAGVAMMVCPGVSAASSRAAVQVAEEFGLLAAVGIHPNSTTEAAPDDWPAVVAMVGHPRVVAIGETGLDRYWDHAPLGLQQEYLGRHLQLAADRDLPVILHCRDAQDDMLPMLRDAAARGLLRGVMHAFSGTAEFAAECLSLGLHLSFAGNVTYSNRKFDGLREVARAVPEDRILVETDSPYLVPQVFRGKRQRNEPANVVHTAAFLAELRGTTPEQFARATTANARGLFRAQEGA
ncbi:MAG: TatD family hydrolase [Planctomycetaceae bacterium]|nr:TatD family hydrolase [Planctomycetaceae bacterium]